MACDGFFRQFEVERQLCVVWFALLALDSRACAWMSRVSADLTDEHWNADLLGHLLAALLWHLLASLPGYVDTLLFWHLRIEKKIASPKI